MSGARHYGTVQSRVHAACETERRAEETLLAVMQHPGSSHAAVVNASAVLAWLRSYPTRVGA